MVWRLSFVLCLVAGLAQADTPAEPEVKECNSCTARHKSLQALQAARVPPKPDPTPEAQEAASGEEETSNE